VINWSGKSTKINERVMLDTTVGLSAAGTDQPTDRSRFLLCIAMKVIQTLRNAEPQPISILNVVITQTTSQYRAVLNSPEVGIFIDIT